MWVSGRLSRLWLREEESFLIVFRRDRINRISRLRRMQSANSSFLASFLRVSGLNTVKNERIFNERQRLCKMLHSRVRRVSPFDPSVNTASIHGPQDFLYISNAPSFDNPTEHHTSFHL